MIIALHCIINFYSTQIIKSIGTILHGFLSPLLIVSGFLVMDLL